MNERKTAEDALSEALRIFIAQDRELVEKERIIKRLGAQLDDALDEVHALRAQLADREAAMARGGITG
jgi:hypothetical protein